MSLEIIWSLNETHWHLADIEALTLIQLITTYGGQYQDIQTTQGSWYGPVEMILPEPISFPLVRTTTEGQSVYPDIALYISNYCVYCIEDQNLTHTI